MRRFIRPPNSIKYTPQFQENLGAFVYPGGACHPADGSPAGKRRLEKNERKGILFSDPIGHFMGKPEKN
jgi:hypothetical protein